MGCSTHADYEADVDKGTLWGQIEESSGDEDDDEDEEAEDDDEAEDVEGMLPLDSCVARLAGMR